MSDMNDFIQKLRSVEQNVSNQPSAVQRLNIFSPKKTSGSPLQQITDFAKNNAVKAPVPTPTNPVNGKWYKGDDPTRGEVIGKALVLKDTDPTKAGEWMSNYRLLQGTKSSRYYDPHSQATNRAVAELQSRGIDTTGIGNPEWFEKNRYLMDYYTPTSGTNEVKTPGKDATTEEQQAFWYRQAYKAMDTTSKAQTELDQVKKDIDWYVNNPGMNLTDQEIKELVMGGLQKNQPTLYAMEQGRASGVPIELNAAVAFNEDLIDGYIWQARNKNKDGSYVTDNPELAMAYAVNGYGNGYEENPELRGKLDPFSGEWKPYSVGSTLEEEGRYFGVYQFSRKWLEDNQAILAGDDEKAKKYYYNVQAAVERSEKIDAETDALDKTIDYYVSKGWSPSKIEQAIQNGSVVPGTGVDGYDDLFDLDKTIEGQDKSKLKGTAWATDYSWGDTRESIAKKVAKKKIADNQDVIDAFGEASEQHANWVLKHENLNQASETVEQFGNNYEKDAFKSIVPGQMGRYALGGFMESVVNGSHRIGAETIDRIAVQNFEDVRTIQAYDDAQAALEQTNANIENTAVDIRMIASSFHNGEYPNTVEEAQQMLAPIYDRFGYDPSVWEVAGLDISQADDMPAWQILNYMSILENDPDNEDALIGLYQAADNLSYDRGRTYDSRWDQWEGSFIDGHWIGSDEEKAECLASAKDVYKLMQANKYAADIRKEETKKGELEGQISSTQEAYDAAQNRRERNAVQLNKAIGYYEADGSKYDSRLMTAMEGMSDIVGKYTPVDYSSTYAYDYMAGMIDPDTGEKAYTPATIYAIATKDMAACAQESANVKAAYALLEKSGYQFSDTERRNMESYVDALDRKGRLASYYVISNDSKYDEYVKAGKALLGAGESGTAAIAPVTILTWLKSEMNPNDPFGNALQMLNSADVLAKVESMTEEDMNRFYAILGRDGEQAAAQYLDDMMNDDYGMITARRSERYSQMTADLVGKDPIIGAIGTAVSVPLKYFGNLEAALYNNFQRGTGQAVGPHSKYSFALDTAYAMREGAKDSLRKLFPFVKEEDFDFVYDALISGAADSLFQAWMTNQAFGSLMQLVPGGDKISNVLSKAADGAYNPIVNTGIKVVSDFSHAAPMGWMAGSEAYRQAILNGASPEQASQVYTITFLAETVSEAITVENIGDMFTAGANATKSGFGTIVKDMVKDAFGEAVGEAWGEWYTWEMEKNIDGYKGEWKKNYDIYMEKYHSEEIATELANQDMMRSVMQAGLAAVISSPVSSGASMYSGARQNRLVGNAVANMGLGAETSLVELGLSTEEGSNTYQIAKNIDESVSKGQKVKNSAYGELFINLLNSNDENINQKARGILDPEYAAVQTGIQQHKAQIEKVDALKWMTEEIGNHSEEEWKAQSKEDMAFLNGESNATPEAAADNISTVLEGTVVKEQSKPESAAAGTRVVNMAKGDTKAATGAVREILSVDGRSKTDISWAALTNGESHSILQEIINKAAAGTEVTADDVVRLHRAANSEQTGSDSEQMKDSYATNVLNKSAVQPAQTETEAAPSETAQVPAAKLSQEQQARLEELEAEQQKVGPYKMKAEDSAELRELQAIRDGEVKAEETAQQEETNDQFIERITESVEETEEDVAEREAEEAQEAEMQSQSEQDQAVALQLQNAKDSGMNDVRVAAILKNGTGFGDADAQAIAQKVLGMAGNGDVAGRVLGGAIGLNPGRSADIKEAIAWAAMTEGQANVRLSELFERTAKGENVNWFDVEAIISLAANERANDQGEQANFARNVLNGRVANEEADIMASENMADATKTEQKAVDSAQNEVTRAEEEFDKADKDAAAAVQNLQAAEAEYDPSPDRQETAATLEQATNRVAGAVAQKTDTRTRLDNAKQKLTDAQAALRARQQEIMNQTRAAATTNAQQNIQQEQEQAAQEQVNRAQEIAEQDRRQEEQDLSDDVGRNAILDLIEKKFPNISEEDKQKILQMSGPMIREFMNDMRQQGRFTVPESLKAQDLSAEEIMNRGKFRDQISKKFGFNFAIIDTTEGNTQPYKNGSYDRSTNTIYLDRNTTRNQMMKFTIGHELLHMAEKAQVYSELANSLLRSATEKDGSLRYGTDADFNGILAAMNNGDFSSRLAQDILRTKQKYDDAGKKNYSYKFALEELTADLMGKLLDGNEELANRMAEENPNVVRRIIDNIKNFLKRAAGMKGTWTKEAKNTIDMLERALKANQWNRARGKMEGEVRNSLPDTNAAQTIITDDNGNALVSEFRGGTVALDTDGVRYSLATFDEAERQRVRDALLAKKDDNDQQEFTKEEVDKYMEDAMGIARMITADKGRLDFDANQFQSFLKPNQDYYFTLDASTLCAKRLLYQGTFNYLQAMADMQNEALMPDDLIDLVNIMRDMGYETPCGICYVESRRRWLDKYAQEWLDSYEGDNKPTLAQLTTSDGLQELRANPETREIAEQFIDAMNAKGSANPKVVQLRTAYNGDIRKLSKNDIQKVKDIGGLRIQSFSDFETPHLLDMIQAVYDMASVGLTSQAYTKVPNFAWVFGDTGIKINLSLIGKGTGLDENGNLVFDNIEGMNFDEAMKLRNMYSANVGTILVGINDNHIIAAMGDPRIDFIIPFHRSGWSKGELSRVSVLNGYSDYTATQNERIILGEHWVEEKDKGQKAVDNWKAKNAESHPNYEIIKQENGKFTIRYRDGYESESFQTHKERTGESLSNFEPVGANHYWEFSKSGEENARTYLKMCAKAHRLPKFWQFLVDNGDGSFSLPEGTDKRSTAIRTGYFKTLIDFKMYDNNGKGSPQTEVKPRINMNQAQRVLNEYGKREDGTYKLGRKQPNGQWADMESNNDLPTAVPAAEAMHDYLKVKRREQQRLAEERMAENEAKRARGEVVKPESDQKRDERITREGTEIYNMYARSAFGAYMGDATLGNTPSENTEEFTNTAKQQMAIDAETGETVRDSLPDIDQLFDDYIENLSAEELDELAKDLFGIPLNTPTENKAKTTPVAKQEEVKLTRKQVVEQFADAFMDAINNGDEDTQNSIIDKLAKATGYTVRGTHRTNADFTVFDRSKQTKKHGATLGDGFYVAAGEGTEYDTDHYGKNRMLVYIKPGKVFDIQKGGLTKSQAKKVYDKYFAPYHPNVVGNDNPYATHVISQLQNEYKVMDYINEAAENANVTTDVIFKELGYNSIKDGPQYVVFDPNQIKSANPVTYDDNGDSIPLQKRFSKSNDIRYSLPSDAPYMAAVERGEMDEAQRMVDEAAKKSGLNVKVFHGTDSYGFTQIERQLGDDGISFFATDSLDTANTYSYDSGIREVKDRLPFGEKDLTTKSGYFRDDDGVLKYLDKLGIEYTMSTDEYGHPSVRIPAWDSSFNDGRHTYQVRFNKDFAGVAAALYQRYLKKDKIAEAFGARPNKYTTGVYQMYGNTDGFLEIDANGENWNSIPFDLKGILEEERSKNTDPDDEAIPYEFEDYLEYGEATTREIAKYAYDHGYPGVTISNVVDNGGKGGNRNTNPSTVYIFFKPSTQLKSADTVTYDDNGNVIPLSERFQMDNPDIRYSLPSDNVLKEQITSWLEGYYNNPEQTTAEPEGPQRQFGNQTAQKSDELDDAVKQWLYDNSIYEPDTNKDQINRAIQWIRSNRQYADDDGFQGSLQKIMNPRFNSQSPDGQARILATMAMSIAKANASGNPIDSVATQVMIADLYNRVGTTAGQTLQARKIFRAMTPEGRIATIRKMLTDEQARLDAKNIHVDLKFSDWLYDAAANAKNEQDMNKVRKEAARQLGEQLPSNWRDKIRSFRMLSMLANPRTHVRNFIGNALFIPAVAIKNKTGALAEMALKTNDKTKTLRPWLPQDIREFAREDARFMKDTLTGEAKYNEETMVQRATNPLGGPIGWLSEKNSNALEWEDWFFLRGHYRRALGGWMVANNYSVEDMKSNTDLLEQGRQYAINEAQKATYRDFNELASKLNGLTRDAKTVWGKTLAFGVDAVLPFKKTPANILRRGLEYSPIGIAKGLYSMTRPLHAYQQAIRNKTEIPSYAKSPNQVIDEICSGLSGTGVMIVGAILANLGAVSVGLNDDDDKFAELRGAQKYAINPGRIINNIFGTHLLGEDVTYTMDWAAPMSMPFFVGAAIQKQFENGGEIDIKELVDALGNVMEPVFNLSMLDGVNSLLKTAQGSDESTLTQIGAKVLSNYATSFVPTIIGATTRTFFDDKRRMAFLEQGQGKGVLGTFRYAWEQTENKIPFMSATNIPVRDIWGNAQGDSFGERLFENFFSPGYIQTMHTDVVTDELERLYYATGDGSMVPSQADKAFTLTKGVTDNPREVVMNAEQWDEYRVARGQLAYQTLSDMMVNPYYLAADDDVKAYMVGEAWKYANQEAKKVIAPDYSPKKNYGDDPIKTIVGDTKTHFKKQTTDSLNAEMIKAVKAGDATAFETTVEALHENGKDDNSIKAVIGNQFRPLYQEAYLSGTEEGMDKMFEIEEMLSMTGYSFDFKKWRKDATKKQLEEELEDNTSGAIGGLKMASAGGMVQPSSDMRDQMLWESMYKNTEGQLYGRGNIDLNHRQVVYNDDGSISTELSFSFYDEDTGKEVLIPTVINGRIVSDDEAIDHYYETGEYLGMFDTPEEADDYAIRLHERQEWFYNR